MTTFSYRTEAHKTRSLTGTTYFYFAEAICKETKARTQLGGGTRDECKLLVKRHKAAATIQSLTESLETLREWNATGETTAAEHADVVRTLVKKLAAAKGDAR